MGGISGFISNSLVKYEQDSVLNMMNISLNHRGPDASGKWTHKDDLISLGHARLSILDLSKLGNQPMKSNSGNLVISYNGCLLYTSPSPRDGLLSRMPSSA